MATLESIPLFRTIVPVGDGVEAKTPAPRPPLPVTLTHITAVGCTVSADELAELQSQAAAAGRELHIEADGDGFYILRNVPIGAKLWRGFVVK